MPIVALITCIFVGFFIKPKAVIEGMRLPDGAKFKNNKALYRDDKMDCSYLPG